jgi:hypothetical protein
MDTGGYFHKGKAAGLEADGSPQTIAEVMKTRIYTSTPSHVLIA